MKKTELIRLLQDNLRLEGDGEVYWENDLGNDESIPVETFASCVGGKVILSK